jgi:hypothetical protein
MKKELSITLALFLYLSACKWQSKPTIWTKEYEQALYNYVDSTCKPSMPDETERSKYASFYVERVKQEIPDGLNSVSKDSLHNLNMRIGREYAIREHKAGNKINMGAYYEYWSPKIEKELRNTYIAIYRIKYPKTAVRFCDCAVEVIKKIYPDSILIPFPKKVNVQIATECSDKLIEEQD